ncbi:MULTISPECIES: Hg(II)-responsive transcriptional regulator [unclassified Idiomarina]|jgi:MerR family mercuric resistance operon transcriptional regulator|uniref:Hg(II)-responsive transcriptional regulator n=1 Tax=unclassified Idiomarina TaxID=2614829 RepID=UPI00257CB705|nr:MULTISPECIES: Hg(II)-responsive transcriptional regulator [unclassified Idiomarina]|tara:strand:- start:10876 stop:11289 length:414 start_codon:yes stop_codon:yes gene_type:complete
MKKVKLTISRLAGSAGVGVETVRYYQKRGLITLPERPLGGLRTYSDGDVERLRFIRKAQELGFNLNEIGELLSLEDGGHCEDISALAERKLTAVREKQQQLALMESALADLVEQCQQQQDKLYCPLIERLHQQANQD